MNKSIILKKPICRKQEEMRISVGDNKILSTLIALMCIYTATLYVVQQPPNYPSADEHTNTLSLGSSEDTL